MKWISATALAAVLLFACNKSETTTSETTSTTETSAMTSTAATDTSSTVVPVMTDTSTSSTTSGTSTSAPSTSNTMTSTSATDTTATGISGSTGSTGTSGSATSTHSENTSTMPQSMMSSSDLVSDGESVYKAKGCAGCHGATGAGDTAIGKKNNIHDFRSPDVQKLSDDELTRILKEGKGQVSKLAHKSKNLTDLQAKSLVAWIRTLK